MSRQAGLQTVSVDPGDSMASHPPAGLIMRQREPANFEFPFDQLDDFLTPNHLFYIRSHFKTPQLDPSRYELEIEGAVLRPFSIRYEELRNMPSVTRPATLECAGNSRIFLSPPAEGVQWQLGAVGTANWTGVPLSALLDRAGLANNACEIVFEAADKGEPKETPKPPGEIRYARSIAIGKAADVPRQKSCAPRPRPHGAEIRNCPPAHPRDHSSWTNL
jgi:DMSO/TMAO reductase YedYZ molybdopterin-dependent catalytic subunit